jgi:hypothetical protein
LLLTALVLCLPLAVAACGGDDKAREKGDPEPDNKNFHVKAETTGNAGPTPLKVKFRARPFNAKGEIYYRWRFDDGTVADAGETTTHVFPKPGYYNVVVDARDQRSNTRWNILIGAWPPSVWAYSERRGRSIQQLFRFRTDQEERTSRRRHQEHDASYRRALE